MHRLIVPLFLLLSLLPSSAAAQSTPACQFVLGFASLHAKLPAVVGTCVDDEQHNPANGDALQQTTTGLLVWRKLDNFTAFTDGYWTWIFGPQGLVRRLNSERFPWEANPSGLALVGASTASSTNTTTSTTTPATGSQMTYHVCAGDTQTAQAIAQFIGGRNFSSTLVSQPDGCGQLTIAVDQQSSIVTSSQTSSRQTVNGLSVQIVNANGATQVTIGAA